MGLPGSKDMLNSLERANEKITIEQWLGTMTIYELKVFATYLIIFLSSKIQEQEMRGDIRNTDEERKHSERLGYLVEFYGHSVDFLFSALNHDQGSIFQKWTAMIPTINSYSPHLQSAMTTFSCIKDLINMLRSNSVGSNLLTKAAMNAQYIGNHSIITEDVIRQTSIIVCHNNKQIKLTGENFVESPFSLQNDTGATISLIAINFQARGFFVAKREKSKKYYAITAPNPSMQHEREFQAEKYCKGFSINKPELKRAIQNKLLQALNWPDYYLPIIFKNDRLIFFVEKEIFDYGTLLGKLNQVTGAIRELQEIFYPQEGKFNSQAFTELMELPEGRFKYCRQAE